ncbi:MAG TPA: magnesium chelatase subunit H [Gemmatimonadales bacterium]|nr:magnesium chelatase subunit H [Gemmatimonadales bacterium]
MRLTLLTLDAHRVPAFRAARERLCAEVPGLELELHVAAEWSDADRLEAARRAVTASDVVIATQLFVDDHIRAILPTLEARRSAAAAMICVMSSPDVMRCTRMGKFSMGGEGGPKSPWSPAMILRRLSGRSKTAKLSGEDQMRQLRRIPQLLRFIPGTAQDVRAYYLVLQYWLSGSADNLEAMLRYVLQRYAPAGAVAQMASREAPAPREYPETGLYHPDVPGRVVERIADLPARGDGPRLGLLLTRSYVLAENTAHYDAVIRALEARGLVPVPAFTAGLDGRPVIDRFFVDADGRATIEAMVALTGFSLVGGPAYNDVAAARAALAQLDVPYWVLQPLELQTVDQWTDDPRGLVPLQATLQVAIPELEGATSPLVFGGSRGTDGGSAVALPGRVERLAGRLVRLVALRRRARADRKVAVMLFAFPPNAGNAGTAAYLAVFHSLWNLLGRLRDEGYAVDVPESVDALREQLLGGNSADYGTLGHVHATISADDHVRREPYLRDIERVWGPAPGAQLSDGRRLFVLGARFGNIFVGFQPGFGIEGDPMRLLFDRELAPTHAFSACYRWLRDDFGADAVLHFGTHGALEFMPGKQVGLSDACWPDRMLGDLPNVYLYASNNPAEGALAKRRGAATLVSYLTPPIANAGLYRGLLDLKSTLERWRSLPPDADAETRGTLVELIQQQAAAVDLVAAEPAWEGDAALRIEELGRRVLELEYTLIPTGLHVVGEPMPVEARTDTLVAMFADRLASTGDAAAAIRAVREGTPHRLDAALAAELARLDGLLATDHELDGLVRALDGRFIAPVPGGDLLRTPDVLPTGRNLHGFDPGRLPSVAALAQARRQVDRLLARHATEGHGLPETIGLVLWGTDNLKSEGQPIAQALALLGAEPRLDALGRVVGAQLLPLATLGRPRIDVVLTVSGVFRDLLPFQLRLLAEAAEMAALADEPLTDNFVRKHAETIAIEHGIDHATAALRVFSNDDGAYGANLGLLVESGAWETEEQLADTFVRRKGFAYGPDGVARPMPELLRTLLGRTELSYQNLESVELGVTDLDQYFELLGGMTRAVKQQRGAGVPVYIGDQTRGDGLVRTLEEQVSLETRTRILNPKWYEGLLVAGHEGVRQVEQHVTNALGLSATTGQVPGWVYQRIGETFVLDPAMRERLARLNPQATTRMAQRLLEANDRGYWQPDDATLDALRDASDALEDRLEGVA